MRVLVCGGLWGLLVASFGAGETRAAAPAAADEDELIRRGVELRRKQDDAGALELFKAAYAVKRSPRAAAQMGLAEFALGRWEDAEAHLHEGLAAAGDPWIRKNEQTLRQSLTSVGGRLGSVEVIGTPAGAEIVIDGRVRGTLPLAKPLRVRTGECRLEVRAPGHVPVARTLQVSSGLLARESVDLVPASGALAAPERAPATGTPAAAAPEPQDRVAVASPPPREPVEQSAGGKRLRIAGWAMLGGAVAVGAAGLVFGLQAQAAGEDNSRPGATFSSSTETSGQRHETLQCVAYATAGVLAAAGVTTYWIGRRIAQGEGSGQAVSLLAMPSDGGALGVVHARF